MGKGAPLRWLEDVRLRRYLRGSGIEIGGLWRKFRVPSSAKVWYLDRLPVEELEKEYPELKRGIVVPDIVADAEQLPIGAGALNFLIASHVLEHLRLPLVALKSWYHALAPGGVLLLRVPDKRHTFDRDRQRTTLQHLVEEAEDPDKFDNAAHYADWVEHVNHADPGEARFKAQMERLLRTKYSIHYHVWTDADLAEIVQYTRQIYRLDWKPVLYWGAHFYRKECVMVLQKSE